MLPENEQHKKRLIERYINNEISEKEFRAFFGLLSTDELDALLEANMDQEILEIRNNAYSVPRRTSLWPRIAAAAAILLIVGLSIFFYTSYYASRHPDAGQDPGLANNDIKPGSNKAYLILSNGKRLSLTDAANGAIAKEAGAEITKTADGQVVYASHNNNGNISGRHSELVSGPPLNTIETPKGGQYQIRLPDGSKVWLNAASKLTYPVSFIGRGQREVTLSGEAYFEIAKDQQHPFRVKSAGQEVEVLGTHFNINSYADEPGTKTTLLEGSVKVAINGGISGRYPEPVMPAQAGTGPLPTVTLKPGEQATLKNNKINILPIDAQSEIAWKNGYFSFNDESIQNIMRVLTRWYDIEVNYQGHITTDGFNGKFSRYKDIGQVLKVLEQTKLVHFKIEGRRVMVSN